MRRERASLSKAASNLALAALERMSTMADAGLLFSIHLDLLTAWLEDLGALASKVSTRSKEVRTILALSVRTQSIDLYLNWSRPRM